MYGPMYHNFRLYLRDRVLRLTLYSESIFEAIDEIFIALFSLSRFISFIGRLCGRSRNYFNLDILSLSRTPVNIYLILYTVTPFNRTLFSLIYFFRAYKSVFNSVNYFIYNILIALSVSVIRVIRSVYRLTGVTISLI